jgi:peptidyl-prolyl cis-trans isomerase D
MRAYNRDQNQFRMPESVKVRHILFKTQGKPPEEEPKIKAQAEEVLKQVKAGGNFAELVKKYSDDTGSVANNGEYSGVVRGQMMPEFEQAAFSLKNGETSLVKTSYGYHIVQTLSHDQARIKPFEEVKKDLADQWKKQRVNDLMQQASDRAEAALKKDPAHPEKVAADLGLELVKADNVEPGKPLPGGLGVSPDFDNAVGTLKKGEVSQPVAFLGNKIAVALVTDVVPARPNTFDEVKDKVRDAIVQTRVVAVIDKHAKELIEKARETGDLAKAAKSMGLDAKTSDEVTRTGAIEGLGAASYVQEGFSRPAGELFGPVSTPDSTVVAKVLAHVEPDLSKLPGERATIRDEIKSQKARDRNSLFEAGLKEALIKQGKVKIHQDVVNRLIAGYKSS